MKIWRCKECDWVTSAEPKGSAGTAHAHAEKHAEWNEEKEGILSLLPGWLFPVADPKILGKYVEKVEVEAREE